MEADMPAWPPLATQKLPFRLKAAAIVAVVTVRGREVQVECRAGRVQAVCSVRPPQSTDGRVSAPGGGSAAL
jgi:hypothetical protein